MEPAAFAGHLCIRAARVLPFRDSCGVPDPIPDIILDIDGNMSRIMSGIEWVIVVDVRFKTVGVSNRIGKLLKDEVGLGSANYADITDCIVLIVCLLSMLKVSKTERRKLIVDFGAVLEQSSQMDYLSFSFDGANHRIWAKTISKYQYKMR